VETSSKLIFGLTLLSLFLRAFLNFLARFSRLTLGFLLNLSLSSLLLSQNLSEHSLKLLIIIVVSSLLGLLNNLTLFV